MNGGPEGTFMTTYHFEGKYYQRHRRSISQAPLPPPDRQALGDRLVRLSLTVPLYFKYIIVDPVVYVYRGHIKLG